MYKSQPDALPVDDLPWLITTVESKDVLRLSAATTHIDGVVVVIEKGCEVRLNSKDKLHKSSWERCDKIPRKDKTSYILDSPVAVSRFEAASSEQAFRQQQASPAQRRCHCLGFTLATMS